MNAKEEFLSHVGSKKVLCAKIHGNYGDPAVFNLTTGWGVYDWSKFLSGLDFEYDSDMSYEVGYEVRDIIIDIIHSKVPLIHMVNVDLVLEKL